MDNGTRREIFDIPRLPPPRADHENDGKPAAPHKPKRMSEQVQGERPHWTGSDPPTPNDKLTL